MTEPSSPSSTTVRKLFALSLNRCAYPGCASHLVDTDTNTILAEICHIHAQSEGGPRFSPLLTKEQVHSFENLLLLCGSHHKVIDARENWGRFDADELRAMKASHEAHARQHHGVPFEISEEAAQQLIVKSVVYQPFSTHVDLQGSKWIVGGGGGQWGGAGGSGGTVYINGTTKIPEGITFDLRGRDGVAPGGGGGGSGAIVHVGRTATDKDLQEGLRISSVFLADLAQIRNGLLNVLGGAWSSCTVPSLPTIVPLCLLMVVELGCLKPQELVRLDVEVVDPQGAVIHASFTDVAAPEIRNSTDRISVLHQMQADVKEFGVVSILVSSGGLALASYDLEFRQPT